MKRKIGFLTIIVVVVTIIISYYNYKIYSKSVNSFVNNVIESVKVKYPDINDQELISIINSNHNSAMNTLKDYGFLNQDMSYLEALNEDFKLNIFFNLAIALVVISIFVIIIIYEHRKREKDTQALIDYLSTLNRGIYDLDILKNSEGLNSILKNEIYKTTVILREKAEREIKDKKILKESLSNISHQLKTPLTSCLILLDNLLYESIDKKTQKEFLEDIKNQIENMNFLIMTILKLSKFDANMISFKKENINLNELLKESIKNLDIIRELKDITIHIKGSEEVSLVGDYKWELEAISNIIKNAIEYTKEQGNIFIEYENNNLYTKVSIKDEGCGLSKEEMHNIFKRFYKGKNSSSNSFGIGLFLAKEIIEHDNGTIKVKSKKEVGTSFIIKYYH